MKTLQERLIAAAEWHAAQSDYFQDGTLLADAAKRIAELEDGFRWVPTSERMPEPQVNVFVRQSDGKVGVCAWWGDDYKFDVTHWMPLPAPPLPFNAALPGGEAIRAECSVRTEILKWQKQKR